jgi:hypothetical protein
MAPVIPEFQRRAEVRREATSTVTAVTSRR